MTIECRHLFFLTAINLFGLTACTDPGMAVNSRPGGKPAPLGVDLGSSNRAPSRVVRDAAATARLDTAGTVQRVNDESDVPATGVINSVNTAQKRLNLTHQPIPAIGWPAMTMDFQVAPSVDLGALKTGNRVNVTLRKGKDGMYEIRSVQPAVGR